MAQRDLPKHWGETLHAESELWVDQGIIASEQRDRMLALYPVPQAGPSERTIRLFTILGSLLIGASILLFLAANWPRMSNAITAGVLLALMLTFYGIGFRHLFGPKGLHSLGAALVFLGALVYGAGIWFIAQIYHFDLHFALGFLLWSAGVLPLAWVTRIRRLLHLSFVLLTVWIVAEPFGLGPLPYLYPLTLLALVLPLARRLGDHWSEAGVWGGFLWWLTMSVGNVAYEYLDVLDHLPFVLARLAILYGTALWMWASLSRGKPWSLAAGNVGAMTLLLGMYAMIFPSDFSLSASVAATPIPSIFEGTPLMVISALSLIAASVAGSFIGLKESADNRLSIVAAWVPICAALILHLPGETSRLVLFNLLLLATTVGLLSTAIRSQRQSLVPIGMLAFIVHLITLYFQLFFTALERSSFFLVGGLLLLAIGWLIERGRRHFGAQGVKV